jgi:hypothetical protein
LAELREARPLDESQSGNRPEYQKTKTGEKPKRRVPRTRSPLAITAAAQISFGSESDSAGADENTFQLDR